MKIEVRVASPADAEEVTTVHASTVERWARFLPDGGSAECSWAELTARERYLMGGPWLDAGACAAHLQGVLESGALPLVAVDQSRHVAGELELIAGPDALWGLTGHIDVMAVRQDVQRKGVGKALVGEARQRAVAAGCSTFTTNPETPAVGFYQRCGLTTVLARQQEVRFPTGMGEAATEPLFPDGPMAEFDSLAAHELRLGRFQTSYATWVKGLWQIPDLTDSFRREEGVLPGGKGRYRLWQYARRASTASVSAWTPRGPTDVLSLLRLIARRASESGYDTLVTTVDEADLARCLPFAASVGEKSMLLGTRIAASPTDAAVP